VLLKIKVIMKTKDLRIGNLVSLSGELPLTIIEINTVYFYAKDKKGENFKSSWAEIQPILITGELLLKLGAVKNDFRPWQSFNLKGLQVNLTNGMWIEYVSQVEITGLHHLQNIFYFRMCEELSIENLL
jgi:hypothetical protein